MKIVTEGIGYIGLSNDILLPQNTEMVALDIIPEKVGMLNKHISFMEDEEIKEYLQRDDLSFKATLDKDEFYKNDDFVNSKVIKKFLSR